MEKNMLSKVQVEKEYFNSQLFITDEIKYFLTYYMQLLDSAFKGNFISEAERNSIAENIFNAILKEVEDEDNYIVINNWLYVLSIYLQSMESWDAYNVVKDVANVSNMLKNAREFVLVKLADLSDVLDDLKRKVSQLKSFNVSIMYNELVEKVNRFKTFAVNNTRVNLTQAHKSEVGDSEYGLMNCTKKGNYLECLIQTSKAFKIEVEIMTKMNAKKAIMQKKKEEMISKKIQERSFELLEKEMKKILQNLKDAYLKEKTQDNVAAEVLRDEYLARKNGILEDWNAKEKLLEQRKVYTDYMILGGEYSLSDLIKEYAIFAKAKKGEIIYPQTAKERGKLLLKLNIEDAIPYFLESNILLSEEERRYLKQVEA